jgi:hypothetical protein
MADVPEGGGGGGGRHQKKRAKKGSTHIDMTPMVDLAFLLLTFFILTTTMYKPSTLQMTFPGAAGEGPAAARSHQIGQRHHADPHQKGPDLLLHRCFPQRGGSQGTTDRIDPHGFQQGA